MDAMAKAKTPPCGGNGAAMTDSLAELAENIRSCFAVYGLERALTYYAGVVSVLAPVRRCISFAYEKKTRIIHTLARVDLESDQVTSMAVGEWELPDGYPRPSSDMELAEPVLSRRLTYEDMELMEGRESMSRPYYVARLPLHVGDKFSLFIALYVASEKVLSADELARCQRLAAPLGEMLTDELLTRNKIYVDAKLELPSSMAGLEMCPALQRVRDKVRRVAGGSTTVLITGETGSGKEMVADAIRDLSPRREAAYVRVNCGALPEGIIDSLLFGHEKGAFTGAQATHRGYFEQAQGGTIFLDEVGELPLQSQTKLLRVLDAREVQHVGGARSIPLDIRVIAATNRDLKAMMGEGLFREDLWYRLCVYPLHVPPLRERKVDIEPLAEHFLAARGKSLGLSAVPDLSDKDLKILYAHPWPGNVRELGLVIERALLDSKVPDGHGGEMVTRLHLEFQDTPPGWTVPKAPDAWRTLSEMTDDYIRLALDKCAGQIFGGAGAAALLGVHPNTLRNWVKRRGQSRA